MIDSKPIATIETMRECSSKGAAKVSWVEPSPFRTAFLISGRACVSATELSAIGAQEGDVVLALKSDGTPPCICIANVGRTGMKIPQHLPFHSTINFPPDCGVRSIHPQATPHLLRPLLH